MKRLLQLWIAIGVLGAIGLEVSAMEPANDPATFFAVSKIGGKGIASLITMSDEQLAATRGGAICAVCSSIISLS
ncbi:MAG: hypothetical protein ACREJU_15045, partial [Nitrospiraceae bacterium]